MSQLGADVAIRSLGDRAHGGVRLRTAIVLLIAAIAAAACSEGPTATSVAGGAASVEPAASAEESEAASAEAASAEASPAAEGPKLFKVGEQIEVSGDIVSSALRVRVVQVKQAKSYGQYSKPAKGNVYLAAKYEYVAVEDGATYNPLDWQVFVDGTAVENYTFVVDGPTPELRSGTLPKGRKASGWVVYEVPARGQVVLSYGANIFGGDAPTFEVVARAK